MLKRNSIYALAGAIGALAVIALVVILVAQRNRDAFTSEQVQEIAAIKAGAERLVIEGRLAEAHAKYQQIEQRVAGRRIRESAVWDLTERAKADQDRVYGLLLSEMESKIIARNAAATQPATRYIVIGNPPPAEEYPSKLLPATRPAVLASTQPANPFEIFRPLLNRVEPTTRPVAGVRPASVSTLPSTQPFRALAIAPIPAPRESVTDEQIGQAIHKGVNFLLQQFKADQIVL